MQRMNSSCLEILRAGSGSVLHKVWPLVLSKEGSSLWVLSSRVIWWKELTFLSLLQTLAGVTLFQAYETT